MPLKQHEADKLIDVIRELIAPTPEGKPNPKIVIDPKTPPAAAARSLAQHTLEGTGSAGDTVQKFDDPKLEDLYQAFKARLLEELPVDPVLLHLLTVRPEILVDVERRIVPLDGTGSDLKGRIAKLIAAGFFAEPRLANDINNELSKTGSTASGDRMTTALDWLKKAGFLILNGRKWIAAPGVKVTERTIEA